MTIPSHLVTNAFENLGSRFGGVMMKTRDDYGVSSASTEGVITHEIANFQSRSSTRVAGLSRHRSFE